MGYKHDQNYYPPTVRAEDSTNNELPPPYNENDASTPKPGAQPTPNQETSVISSNLERRRSLLLVYVHGFMGNETSFQKFPTHVHNLLCERLADQYAVQSIVYPKYKSRKKIDFARDELVNWLGCQAVDDADVILVGHSMGGLLVAEIALSVSEHRSEANSRYRIIGTINLDTPFLGMHPGIVVSGLSSLFRPTPEHSDSQELSSQVQQLGLKPSLEASSLLAPEASSTSLISSASTLHLSPSTPSINPDSSNAFQSDQRPAKQSTWEKAFYFLNKHSGDLTKATRAYFTSHLEFGGCLADPKGLMSRYSRIIALDEQGTGYKVHFVNYYTASTGRPKKPKTPKVEEKGAKPRSPENEIERLEREARSLEGGAVDESSNRYPRKSSEDDQSQILTSAEEALQEASGPDLIPSGGEGTLGISDPPPASISLQTTQSSSANESSTMKPLSSPTHSADDLLPPLPSKPTEPPPFDPTSYKDKDILKIATRDHARLTKAYQRALKDRDKAIADRRKMLVKRAKDEERRSKTEAKKMKKSVDGAAVGGRDAVDMDETGPLACPIPGRASSSSSSLQPNAPSHPPPPLPPAATAPQSTAAQTSPILHHSPQNPSHNQPQQKPHTFCLLPPKRPSADLDPHWIRIFMPGVDEVGAHCGLFDQGGAHYEGLVGDLVGRVEGWVGER